MKIGEAQTHTHSYIRTNSPPPPCPVLRSNEVDVTIRTMHSKYFYVSFINPNLGHIMTLAGSTKLGQMFYSGRVGETANGSVKFKQSNAVKCRP